MIILYIAIFLFIGYTILIIYYWLSWRSVPEFIQEKKIYSTTISLIIPARNEEENIGKLLNALQKQTYPKNLFEIIVVNDHSDDKTIDIVKQFPDVILLDLKDDSINSYKKKSIEQGINAASRKLIITTDADCIPPLIILLYFKFSRPWIFWCYRELRPPRFISSFIPCVMELTWLMKKRHSKK